MPIKNFDDEGDVGWQRSGDHTLTREVADPVTVGEPQFYPRVKPSGEGIYTTESMEVPPTTWCISCGMPIGPGSVSTVVTGGLRCEACSPIRAEQITVKRGRGRPRKVEVE